MDCCTINWRKILTPIQKQSIFVILTVGNLFWILSIILAVPGYAVLKVITSNLYDWFKNWSGLYA